MTGKNFSLWLLLSLAGFSSTASAELKIFACEPEWAALSEALGGERVSVYRATHAGQDVHKVQARPSLIARLRSADLAVCSGAELEVGWLPMLQRRARNPRVLPGAPGYFEAAQQVSLLEIPRQLDRADGDVHGEGNPHIQLDPRRLLQVARALSARLQTLDPAHRDHYRARLADFAKRWESALSGWRQRAEPLRGKRAIVHHREWIYLLDWLAIERIGSLEPKPGVPPSLSHLSHLKSLVGADWIILSPLDDPKPAHWLHEQTAGRIVTLPHTVGANAQSENLFALFDDILSRLLGDEG
jgi:zinc/manganese transport system substrate-binding protein